MPILKASYNIILTAQLLIAFDIQAGQTHYALYKIEVSHLLFLAPVMIFVCTTYDTRLTVDESYTHQRSRTTGWQPVSRLHTMNILLKVTKVASTFGKRVLPFSDDIRAHAIYIYITCPMWRHSCVLLRILMHVSCILETWVCHGWNGYVHAFIGESRVCQRMIRCGQIWRTFGANISSFATGKHVYRYSFELQYSECDREWVMPMASKDYSSLTWESEDSSHSGEILVIHSLSSDSLLDYMWLGYSSSRRFCDLRGKSVTT